MINNFRLINLLILYMLFNMSAYAEVIKTTSLGSQNIDQINQWIDQDTIVFVELDSTLIVPESNMFLFSNNPYCSFLGELLSLGKSQYRYYQVLAKWYVQRKIKLVDKEWVSLINQVHIKGAKIYLICSMPMPLTNIEDFRFNEVTNLGIRLSKQVNNQNKFTIRRDQDISSFWYARFSDGIIYNGPFHKSQAILDFLKVTNVMPKKLLVFCSDELEVKTIDRALRRFDIDFKTVLYLGAYELTGTIDPNIIKFQQQSLIEQGIWYEDEEARNLLKAAENQS